MEVDSKKAKYFREQSEIYRAIQAGQRLKRDEARRGKRVMEAETFERKRQEASKMAQSHEIVAMAAEGIGN